MHIKTFRLHTWAMLVCCRRPQTRPNFVTVCRWVHTIEISRLRDCEYIADAFKLGTMCVCWVSVNFWLCILIKPQRNHSAQAHKIWVVYNCRRHQNLDCLWKRTQMICLGFIIDQGSGNHHPSHYLSIKIRTVANLRNWNCVDERIRD